MRTQAQKEWYLKNKERVRTTRRKYERANPEMIKRWNTSKYARYKMKLLINPKPPRSKLSKEERLKRRREWYYANRESVILKQRESPSKKTPNAEQRRAHVASTLRWNAKNKDKVHACARRYYQNNCAKLKAKQLPKTRLRRARIVHASVGNIETIAKWERTWRAMPVVECYWCSRRISSKKCHVDHIEPISKGGMHAIENLAIACAKCNTAKGAATMDSWNKRLLEPILL